MLASCHTLSGFMALLALLLWSSTSCFELGEAGAHFHLLVHIPRAGWCLLVVWVSLKKSQRSCCLLALGCSDCTLLLVEPPLQSSEQSDTTAVRKGCLPSGGKPSSAAGGINRNWGLSACEGEKPLPFPNPVLLKFIFHLLNSVVTRNTILGCGCVFCLFFVFFPL